MFTYVGIVSFPTISYVFYKKYWQTLSESEYFNVNGRLKLRGVVSNMQNIIDNTYLELI